MTDEDKEFIAYPSNTSKGYMEAEEGDGIVMNRPNKARGTVQKDTAPTLTTGDGCGTGVVVKDGIEWPSLNGSQEVKDGDGVIPSRPYSTRKSVMEKTSFAIAATAIPGVAVLDETGIKVAGKMTDTNFGQDQQVFSEDSISPTLRAEAHGHQPLVEVTEDDSMDWPQLGGSVKVRDGDGVIPSRPNSSRKSVMEQTAFAVIASGTTGGVCVRDGADLKPVPITEMVKVRVHEVDLKALYELLRDAKESMGVTASDISKALNVPRTTVEHWFRNDDGQSIPDADIWFALKDYLRIEDDSLDAQITEFEERESSYEMSERAYHEDGIAPTIKASASEKIATEDPSEQLPELQEGEVAAMHEPGREKKFQNGPRFNADGSAFTLTTRGGDGIAQRTEGRLRIRYLTPLECWRLQAFPDEAYYKAVEAGMSKSAAYKQAGNSITTTVLQNIFERAFVEQTWKKKPNLTDWGL